MTGGKVNPTLVNANKRTNKQTSLKLIPTLCVLSKPNVMSKNNLHSQFRESISILFNDQGKLQQNNQTNQILNFLIPFFVSHKMQQSFYVCFPSSIIEVLIHGGQKYINLNDLFDLFLVHLITFCFNVGCFEVFHVIFMLPIEWIEFGLTFNPLVTDPIYLACMAKILTLKKEGIIEKFPMSVAPMSR